MAVTGQQHVDGLIGYYRSQIDNYNNERAEWALHYEQLKDSASNKHSLQRQLDACKDNINYFQGELNTTKANLAK
jgi:DNA repair ATPase RecN